MDWWHRMRRAWTVVSARIKLRKSGPGGGGGDGGVDDAIHDRSNAILKLQNDVQMCGYSDVQVLWNMLSETDELVDDNDCEPIQATSPPKCTAKHRVLWRIFFWTDHPDRT